MTRYQVPTANVYENGLLDKASINFKAQLTIKPIEKKYIRNPESIRKTFRYCTLPRLHG